MKQRLSRSLWALAAFACLAWLTSYLFSLPGALEIDKDKHPAAHLEERLSLRGVAGRVLTITSAAGSSVAVEAPNATLTADTRSGLAALGQATGDVAEPIQWVNLGAGGGGSSISLTLLPKGRRADLEVRRTLDQQSAELRFTPRAGSLEIAAVVPYSDAPSSNTVLHLGAQTITQQANGATPIAMSIPDGATVVVRLSRSDADKSDFALGSPLPDNSGTELALSAVTIGDSDETRLFYCGAKRGAVLWRKGDIATMDCASVLHATRLEVADTTGLDLFGPAFQSMEGTFAPVPIVARIASNGVVAAFIGLCYAAVATWLFRTLFTPPKTAG